MVSPGATFYLPGGDGTHLVLGRRQCMLGTVKICTGALRFGVTMPLAGGGNRVTSMLGMFWWPKLALMVGLLAQI
jgi:hypothetical protein